MIMYGIAPVMRFLYRKHSLYLNLIFLYFLLYYRHNLSYVLQLLRVSTDRLFIIMAIISLY